MTNRELMQQALEALNDCTYDEEGYCLNPDNVDAILALRAAIEQAQPEQEPVAWVYPEGLEALKSGRPWTAYGSNGYSRIPLYLNDAVARRVEPPAAESGAGFESLPASPKWQGLTDEERGITAAETWGSVLIAPQSYQAFARAIEAKLKEKNT